MAYRATANHRRACGNRAASSRLTVIAYHREREVRVRVAARRWPRFRSRWPDLNFEGVLEQTDVLHVPGHCRSGNCKMLTMLAILAGPILVATILIIAVSEIRDAWDRNRLR